MATADGRVIERFRALLTHPSWPRLPQALVLVCAVPAGAALFVGPDLGERNIGSFLLWHLWWAAIPVAALLAGRVWCAVCPVSLLDAAHSAHVLPPLRWPAILVRGEGWLLAGSLLAVHLANLWFRFEDDAAASRGFVAAMAVAAAATTLLVRNRPWCRSLCPAGAFSGVLARAAPWRIAADQQRCGRPCGGTFCRGEAGAGLCPVGEDPRREIDQGHCILCGDCLSDCPAALPVRGRSLRLPDTAAAPTLVLLGVVVDALLVQINDWPILFWRLSSALGLAPAASLELALHAAISLAPLIAGATAARVTGRLTRSQRLSLVAGAALPVAAAGAAAVAARELLVTAPLHLGQLLAAAGHGGFGVQAVARALDGLPVRAVQEASVALGVLGAVRFIAPVLRAPEGRAAAAVAGLLVAAAGLALAWGFSRPLGL